ncbi:MAG: hypothetical protein RL284_1642 [Bacteroidota bacterium]|jgi:hypothetical protein
MPIFLQCDIVFVNLIFLKKDKKQAFDKAENETIEKIIKYTGLTKEEIEKL